MSSDIDTSQYLKAFSLADSKKKIDEIDMILTRKIGDNWRRVVFLMVVVIVIIILLIIYGINIDDSPYKNTFSHIKVFFIILLISISFFFVWAIIKPRTYNIQKGVVPFPPSDTLVPIDSTQCGIFPTECTNSDDCDSLCKNKNGMSNYSCHKITHPNTYYLGTKLEVGKSYCLPNISELNDINKCGTYTGRIVWANNPDGTMSWKCQCLYPDLFSGSDCTKQIACKMEYTEDGIPKTTFAPLVDSNGNVFSSSESPPGDVKTPYDLTSDGKPRFKCSCLKGFYTKDYDPFTCNRNICASGEGATTDFAKFEENTDKCVCEIPLFKSNISGFCYPIDVTEPNCNLNIHGNGCKYGIDIFLYQEDKKRYVPVMFLNKGRYYMSDKRDVQNNHYLLDITDLVNSNVSDKTQFVDITNSVLKDAFYSYQVKVATSDYLTDLLNNLNEFGKDMKQILGQIVLNAGRENIDENKNNTGVARRCNSFFYKWDDVSIDCEDQLSKTGTESIAKNIDCGGNNFKIVMDLDYYPWGYHCDCGTNGRKNPGCDKIQSGQYNIKNADGTIQTVYGEYIDRIVCNDNDPEFKDGNGPQKCIGDCIPDGQKNTGGYTKCCFYEERDGKGIANFRVFDADNNKIRWLVPDDKSDPFDSNSTNVNIVKNHTCVQRERMPCKHDDECIGNCSHMGSSDDGDQVCCPNGSDELDNNIILGDFLFWCNGLGTGEKCNHGYQCDSKICLSNGTCK